MYPSPNFNNYQHRANLILSVFPLTLPSYYFSANARHHIISSVNNSYASLKDKDSLKLQNH